MNASPAPILSVVVPVYNRAAVLPQLFASLLQPCRLAWELVVVDDGSTDATPSVLEQWKDRLPLRVIRGGHHGAGAARNAGALEAAGRYIGFVDSDDVVLPFFLERVSATLAARGPDVLTTGMWLVAPQGRRRLVVPHLAGPHQRVNWCAGQLFIRREIFAAVGGYDPQVRSGQHMDLWARIREAHGDALRVEALPEPLYTYHTASADGVRLDHLARVQGVEHAMGSPAIAALSGASADDCRAGLLGSASVEARRAGLRSKAIRYAWEGLRRDQGVRELARLALALAPRRVSRGADLMLAAWRRADLAARARSWWERRLRAIVRRLPFRERLLVRRLRILRGRARCTSRDIRTLSLLWANTWAAPAGYIEAALAALRSNPTGDVLECGSGLSTLVLGAMASSGAATVISLENDPRWAQTVRRLAAAGGLRAVQVVDAPLTAHEAFDWYSLPCWLDPSRFDVVLCDGPPRPTRGGRIGFFHCLAPRLRAGSFVLVDDVHRLPEHEMLVAWSRTRDIAYEFVAEGPRAFARVQVRGPVAGERLGAAGE